MAANTEALDDGKYVTHSSLSVVASRATLKAQDVTATSQLSGAGLNVTSAITTPKATVTSTFSAAGVTLADTPTIQGTSAMSANRFTGQAGTALIPTYGVTSEVSLGLYRSAASVMALSYGTLSVTGISAAVFASSATTAQSGATAKLGQGQLYFSVLSLDTNGGEFGFRSGNTVYRFASVAVG